MPKKNSIAEQIEVLQKTIEGLHAAVATNKPQLVPVTVSEIIKTAREELMVEECNRLNAKLQPDGTMKERDTSTYRAYNTHWKRFEKKYGSKQLSEVTAKNIADFPKFAATTAKRIAKARGHEDSNGSRGFNMAIDAMNFLWVIAERDSHAASNPILKLTRKKRAKGARHGVPSDKLNEFVQAAGTGGKDPRLDYLIAWFLCETAARRAGLLNLKLGDLDAQRCTVWLSEKNDLRVEQPVSPSLMHALLEIAATRSDGKPKSKVFLRLPTAKIKKHRPIDGHYLDAMFKRIRMQLAWAMKLKFSAHWARHGVLTAVERGWGLSTSAKYARHSLGGVTSIYSSADIVDVAKVLQALTGEKHPLAA